MTGPTTDLEPFPAKPDAVVGQVRFVLAVVAIAVLFCYPLVLSAYQMDVARDALIFALLALSLDLLWGKVGILSFAQAAYFGFGAYAVAVVGPMVPGANGAIAGLGVGLALAVAVSGAIGYLLVYGGVRGPYLTIVTLALTLVVRNIATSWASVTGGEAGLIGAPPPGLAIGGWSVVATSSISLYILVALILAAALLAIWLSCRQRYGRLLLAIQDDEFKARSLGYDTSGCILVVFVLSGALATLAGGLYASVSGYVAPDLVGLLLATQVIVQVALGGRGTLVGPVIAAIVLIRLQQAVSSFSYALWPLFLGAFFIAMVFVFPQGLLPPFARWLTLLLQRPRAST